MVNFLGRFFRTGGKVSFVKIGGQALVLVALVLGLVAFVGNNKTITVNVDGQASSVQTFGGSVSQVLKKANVVLKPADRVTPALAASVDNGTVINVNTSKEIKVNLNGAKSTVQTTSTKVRDLVNQLGLGANAVTSAPKDMVLASSDVISISTPKSVTILADGKSVDRTTTAVTVGDLLASSGTSVGPADLLSQPADAPVVDNMVVKVSRVNDAGTTTVTTDIPFKTDKTVDPNTFKDQQSVTQAGVVGKLETSFKVVTVDGREVSRTQTGQQVTTAAVDQKITVGGKDRPARPRRGRQYRGRCPRRDERRDVGQDRAVRVRRQLADQHRQRLLRRTAVRQRDLAGQRRRRVRPARRPGQPRAADRRRQYVLCQGRALAVGLRLRRLPVETLRLHYDGRVTEPDSDPQTGRPDVRRGSGVQPLLGASDIRRLAEEIGVRPTKTLGQNFVIDGNTIRRIVAAAHLAPQETVLEVDPDSAR